MVIARKPFSNANLTMFTKLNYQPSCFYARPNKLHCVNQQAIDYERVRDFF